MQDCDYDATDNQEQTSKHSAFRHRLAFHRYRTAVRTQAPDVLPAQLPKQMTIMLLQHAARDTPVSLIQYCYDAPTASRTRHA
jgi:hypothetical protein